MKYITITEAVLSESKVEKNYFKLVKRRLYLGGSAFYVEDFKYSKEEEEEMKKELNKTLNDKYYDGELKSHSVAELYKKLLVSNAIIKVLDGSSKIGRWFYVKETQEEIYKMLDNA